MLKKILRSGQGGNKGFSLVEILIVLALIGILMAVVVPNLGGFLGRGKDQAYGADVRIVQAAANAYYTDTSTRPGARKYPTGDGAGGAITTNHYINMDHLVSGGYLNDVPQSATTSNTTTSGKGLGTYSWYVDATGKVLSSPTYTSGIYP